MSSASCVIPSKSNEPSFMESSHTGGWKTMLDTLANTSPRYPPLEVLPCANINICNKPGKQTCSACKMVSYCSKECQTIHWVIHKQDCKNAIRSSHWKPCWVVEGRKPTFVDESNMSTAEEFASRRQDRLSIGVPLWGNVPAMDIINLPNNEKDLKADLSLAFAASGDIRNTIATVNALEKGYSGKLDILLNDINPYIVYRNITLLLILGTISDEVLAADMALHFWYSVFMPTEYHSRIMSMVSAFLMKGSSARPTFAGLGCHSTLTCQISSDVQELLVADLGCPMSSLEAQNEYLRVRNAPSHADFRDRMYMGLKPSHRLAFLHYRRCGVILPFGADKTHFKSPNRSLFADGMWLQTDYADPLESWDLDKVFHAGKAHGVQPEDVYGCLYFYLTDQLRIFAQQIRRHRISFRIFNSEACALAQGIAQGAFTMGYGFPRTTQFDRIDVSNIMDPNYVGIRRVMEAWGPLLAKSSHAAFTGYFMNWVAYTENARAADADPSVVMDVLRLMKRSNRLPLVLDPKMSLYLAMNSIDAFRDNSKAFFNFWMEQGGADVKLKLRAAHKIIPHRFKTDIDAKPDALPAFADDETWYRYIRLINRTWVERFVELCHGPA